LDPEWSYRAVRVLKKKHGASEGEPYTSPGIADKVLADRMAELQFRYSSPPMADSSPSLKTYLI
jgi:hypothetical protein